MGQIKPIKEIIERMHENDIVITQDIPLAAQVIEKAALPFIPEVKFIPLANVKARLFT